MIWGPQIKTLLLNISAFRRNRQISGMLNLLPTIGIFMEWKIIMHEEKNYLEIVTKGIADKDSSLEMAKAISETMRKHRLTKALIDHRNVTKVTGRMTDVYQRPKLFKLIGMILGIKIAEVINPAHQEHFRFLETVCVNQGFKFSVFFEKESALEWLLK